ncbi:VWA domain-containing protein [Porticoccus sp. W117]|uniref:VWA domain-containing protein n=1 Tax=Porticoccus sp. W117 TaxID=3054777 RepID=UPI0025916896|nr:VWA domain-containing protein [Porticoccus sp. W117]MDM3871089.1 VWA domain-containing protein [Porticoccus sp. W117]
MADSATLVWQWSWLLWLLPAPWLYRALRPALAQQSAALTVPVYQQLLDAEADTQGPARKSPWAYLLLVVVWLGCLLAAARPVWIGEEIELPTSGRDLLLAVDISESMNEPDMPLGRDVLRRILAAKAVVGQFVERRSGDRLGLILFGGQAYLQAPLTFDRTTVNQLLQEAELGMAGSATAIGDAIGLAVKQLKERPENHRILILLTDGSNTAGTLQPVEAAQAAAQLGIKIYTVGIGGGRNSWFSRNQVDEKTLLEIANLTDGQFYRAKDVQQLNNIYHHLDELEPVEQDAETLRPSKALFHWPLSAALLAALLLLARRLLLSQGAWRGRNG